MSRLQLWKEDPVTADGSVTSGVTIEDDGGEIRRLWFRVPERFADRLTGTCNPFVTGTVFTAMREGKDLVVHGEVSSTLLRNLEEFQAAWSMWHPDRYAPVEITAETERDLPAAEKSNDAMAAFSGGVDGAFTVYRHSKGLCGRLQRDIRAGVFIHGFNIGLDRQDIFDSAAEKAGLMLDSLGIELITVATNFRDLGDNFRDAHAAEIASCLSLFENRYPAALIASSEPYNDLIFPWGSNPITDRLLSSDRLEFIHDANAFTRSDKIEAISGWTEALEHLRVCWQIDNLDRNCCRCEKCIRTILNFRAHGIEKPGCFDEDATDSMIRNMRTANTVTLSFIEEILETAREKRIRASWVSALETAVKRNRKRLKGWRRQVRQIRNRYALKTRLKEKFSKK